MKLLNLDDLPVLTYHLELGHKAMVVPYIGIIKAIEKHEVYCDIFIEVTDYKTQEKFLVLKIANIERGLSKLIKEYEVTNYKDLIGQQIAIERGYIKREKHNVQVWRILRASLKHQLAIDDALSRKEEDQKIAEEIQLKREQFKEEQKRLSIKREQYFDELNEKRKQFKEQFKKKFSKVCQYNKNAPPSLLVNIKNWYFSHFSEDQEIGSSLFREALEIHFPEITQNRTTREDLRKNNIVLVSNEKFTGCAYHVDFLNPIEGNHAEN